MSTIHVEVLNAGEAVELFEQTGPGQVATIPEPVTRFVPGLTHCRVVPVPALEVSAPVTGARAVMLLGAARNVTSPRAEGELTPGDVLLLAPVEVVTVQASDDDQDDAVLLVMT